jgi:hypothetical protein
VLRLDKPVVRVRYDLAELQPERLRDAIAAALPLPIGARE